MEGARHQDIVSWTERLVRKTQSASPVLSLAQGVLNPVYVCRRRPSMLQIPPETFHQHQPTHGHKVRGEDHIPHEPVLSK